MEKLAKIKKCACFKNLNTMDFNAILRCLQIRIRKYKPGETIEYIGATPKFVYIVLSGRARASSINENGTSLIHLDYTQDMIFGLEYSLNKSNYKEDFIAVEETTLIVCDITRMVTPCENRCPRHYQVINECIKQLSTNFSQTKGRVVELGQSKTKEKVMSYLKKALPKANKFYTIPYNRQELAEYLGVERTALSAELSALAKDGYIEFHKSSFMRKK